MDTAVFIDGGYLSKVLDDYGRPRISYHGLAQWAANDRLLRAYYYDCLPWQSNDPTEEEKERVASKQGFFNRLRYGNRMTVREGRLRRGVTKSNEIYYEQKGVDLQLGIDIASLVATDRIRTVVILAGDGDFIPAVEYAKERGVIVKLVHGAVVDGGLQMAVDESIDLTRDIINDLKLGGA